MATNGFQNGAPPLRSVPNGALERYDSPPQGARPPLSSASSGNRDKIVFTANRPHLVTLEDDDGTKELGNYGDQYRYWLTERRVMWINPDVRELIIRTGAKAGDTISIGKFETKDGHRRKIVWRVERPEPETEYGNAYDGNDDGEDFHRSEAATEERIGRANDAARKEREERDADADDAHARELTRQHNARTAEHARRKKEIENAEAIERQIEADKLQATRDARRALAGASISAEHARREQLPASDPRAPRARHDDAADAEAKRINAEEARDAAEDRRLAKMHDAYDAYEARKAADAPPDWVTDPAAAPIATPQAAAAPPAEKTRRSRAGTNPPSSTDNSAKATNPTPHQDKEPAPTPTEASASKASSLGNPIAQALEMAVAACALAERHAAALGLPLRWTSEDIRCLAVTILIDSFQTRRNRS